MYFCLLVHFITYMNCAWMKVNDWARFKNMDKSGSMKINVVNHGSSFWSFYKCKSITL